MQLFIAHTRAETAFVNRLSTALTQAGHTLAAWDELPDSPAWWTQISASIDAADTLLLVITPAALDSPIVQGQTRHARSRNKRIVALWFAGDDGQQTDALIDFRTEDNFDAAFATLLQTLEADAAYVQQHTRLLLRAEQPDVPLDMAELLAAENWLAQSGSKQPRPTEAQMRYIHASRRASAERRRTTLRWLLAAVVLLIGLVSLVTLLALRAERRHNAAAERAATAESALATAYLVQTQVGGSGQLARARQLAAQSRLLVDREYDLALLLAVQAGRLAQRAGVLLPEIQGSLLYALQAGPPISRYLDAHAPVTALALSADGSRLAVASEDGLLRLWDTASGDTLMPPLASGLRRVELLSFSSDAARVVLAGDGQIALWDAAAQTVTPLPFTADPFAINALSFAFDDSALALGGAGGLLLIDAFSGEVIKSPFPETGAVARMAFSPDGTRLLTARPEGTVLLWSQNAGVGTVLDSGAAPKLALSFSADSSLLLAVDAVGTLYSWDTEALTPPASETLSEGPLTWAQFSPNGARVIAQTADGKLLAMLLDAGTVSIERIQSFDVGYAVSAAGSARSSFALAGDGGRITLWDGEREIGLSSQQTRVSGSIAALSVSADGAHIGLLSCEESCQVVIRDTQALGDDAGSFAAHGDNPAFPHLLITPNQAVVLARCAESDEVGVCRLSEIQVYDQAGEELTRVSAPGTVSVLAVSADGSRIAAANCPSPTADALSCPASEVRVWDALSGEQLSIALHDTANTVLELAFCDAGLCAPSDEATAPALLAADAAGTVTRWSLSGERLTPWQLGIDPQRLTRLSFSLDGARLAAAECVDVRCDTSRIRIWDMRNGSLITTLDGLTQRVWSLAFNTDASWLAVGDDSGRVQVWDANSGAALGGPLVAGNGVVSALVFAPDTLLAATGDTLYRWAMGVESWAAQACAIANRSLTIDEWAFYLEGERYQATCEAASRLP
ncbi:MAG: TIR domain-containing protein [Anaerolineae bacterium]|nr:TIR domain-containing protein [Anaerolineae bacterium]